MKHRDEKPMTKFATNPALVEMKSDLEKVSQHWIPKLGQHTQPSMKRGVCLVN